MTNEEHIDNSYEIKKEILKTKEILLVDYTIKSFYKLCENIEKLTPKDFVECAIYLINSLPKMGYYTALKIATYLYSIRKYLPEDELQYILGLNGDKYGKVKYPLFDTLQYPTKQMLAMIVEYHKNNLEEQNENTKWTLLKR